MSILPEPIFFRRIVRGSGPKRKLIHLENKTGEDWAGKVTDVAKPEWIDVEKLLGETIEVPGRQRMPIVVNVDSSHQFFPMSQVLDDKVEITFEDGMVLQVPITIQEVIAEQVDYPGVFAMDFGTSNTCYAYKNRFDPASDPAKANQPAHSSKEIPSLVFFKDVSLGSMSKYSIGTDAAFDIKEYSWQTYSYFMSIKRMLGSGKELFVLDRDAGHTSAHRQLWSTEKIAAFIIKEVVNRAEDELGAQIQRIVATYPTLYSRKKCDALLAAYKEAFEMMGREWNDERVSLVMDEANAAAFNYIYGELLSEFRKFAQTETRTAVLSYDFGGGTVDVAFLDVGMGRDEQGRIKVSTEVRGITGDLYFGGDNITLAAFKMLKNEVVRIIAEERHSAPVVTEETVAKSDSPFGDLGDIFSVKAEEELSPEEEAEKAKRAAEAEETADEPNEVHNREEPDRYQAAIDNVWEHSAALKLAFVEGMSIEDALKASCEKESRPFENAELTRLLEDVERVLPTQFVRYENEDPHKEDASKKLFYELWQEADQMKVRLSSRGGDQRFDGLLKRTAQYASVDPKAFNDNLSINYAQLERCVRPAVESTIRRTHALYVNATKEREDGLADVPLRILLAGNSSKLPLVRSLFCEIFECAEKDLVFQADRLKTAVAQGGCEDESLRRDFGRQGLIQWEAVGAVDRLPYAIGLYSADLVGPTKYEDGFITLFERGTAPGEEAGTFTATKADHFLVHSRMERLAVYANYRDGTTPAYLGLFDFEGPIDPGTPEEEPYEVTLELMANRGVKLSTTDGSKSFEFKTIDESIEPELNPFSGVH